MLFVDSIIHHCPFHIHSVSQSVCTMETALLSCTICNKKPHFSDVSHLLTHVASKAHLSSHFKLQVNSRHDLRARADLTKYDRWYEENHIARLLSDRMASSRSSRRRRSKRSIGSLAGKVFRACFFCHTRVHPAETLKI